MILVDVSDIAENGLTWGNDRRAKAPPECMKVLRAVGMAGWRGKELA